MVAVDTHYYIWGRKKCLFVELSDSFRCFSEFVIIFAK